MSLWLNLAPHRPDSNARTKVKFVPNDRGSVMISTLYPLGGNYGGVIQAYALQQVLRSLGYDVFTLNSRRRFTSARETAQRVRHTLRSFLRLSTTTPPITGKGLAARQASVTEFVERKLRTVDLFAMSRVDRRAFLGELKAIIVGSDQVWRGGYADVLSQMLIYARRFNMVKASYAASFGADQPIRLSKRVIRKSKPLIQSFDGISVREASGVRLCRELWGVEAQNHVDPTLLLDRAAYIELMAERVEAGTVEKPNLFAYILDNNLAGERIVTALSAELGLPIQKIYMDSPTPDGPHDVESPLRMASVESWLKHFYSAKFVVTDSFHGTVFSIIFQKPFITLGNEARGLARFSSLLKILGLEDRLVDVSNPILPEDLWALDWRTCKFRIAEEKERALRYLTDVLDYPQ